jgi:hypothetical protein
MIAPGQISGETSDIPAEFAAPGVLQREKH